MNLSHFTCLIVTALSAFVSLGYSVAAARSSCHETAYYALARSVSLAVLVVVALANGSGEWLSAAALSMILVQGIDALIGAAAHDRMKTLGPLFLSVVNLASLVWFSS